MRIAYMPAWDILTSWLWTKGGNTLRWKHKIGIGYSVFKISCSAWYGRWLV